MSGFVFYVLSCALSCLVGFFFACAIAAGRLADEREARRVLSLQLAERDRSLAFAALAIAGVDGTTVEEAVLLLDSYGKEPE